ncbi:reverse transcriptase domain-containing protein [Tanacetum coccineum]
MGLPAWQSVCLQFDPRATRGHLMIGKDSRVKIKTERSVLVELILFKSTIKIPQLIMEGKPIRDGLPGPSWSLLIAQKSIYKPCFVQRQFLDYLLDRITKNKDENKSQNDKTGLEWEKRVRKLAKPGQNLHPKWANLTDMLSKFVTANTAFYFGSGTLPGNTVTNLRKNFKKWSSFNKLPKKLGDPGRFLIPCEFTGITTCNALADLGASINLMPYSVWKDLALPELTPTCMTLELADRSITEPIGIAKDVRLMVGKFQFPADFVVVDFEPDQSPLIRGRCFLKTSHALIDVYEGEITLRVGKEAITFNLDQTLKYTADYNHMTVNKIDVIDMACDEYSQEVLGFSNVIASGNPTPYFEPIVSTASPNLTPFGDSDFLLMEEADSFLALEDDPTSSEVDPTYQDPEGDILLLEAILNTKTVESSVDEPPEVELKELPPHLEYAFLEGDDKLPVIIAKDLKDEEKAALLKVLKSHKRAIAWKLSDIKGVSPEFCTHKILMEEDYEPSVQSQRRVNPKIHDVIKKEVEKLLDAGLIYPISDSPWVSPVHCVPKKGGITVITNDENELIPTRLVTGWRVCIDYRKLNEATRKDHFPLPFMDQMLERLAGNQYYCFLDGFSGYFQIPIDPKDQEKTTFTCPYGTFAYRRMPFGLCNAPGLENPHQDQTREQRNQEDFLSRTLGSIATSDQCTPMDSIGPPISRMPMTLSPVVTFVKVKEKFRQRDEMPQSPSKFCEIFDIGGIDFMGPLFRSSRGNKFGGLTQSSLHRIITPQTSGQVEVSNRGLKLLILESNRGEKIVPLLSDKLDDALWASAQRT